MCTVRLVKLQPPVPVCAVRTAALHDELGLETLRRLVPWTAARSAMPPVRREGLRTMTVRPGAGAAEGVEPGKAARPMAPVPSACLLPANSRSPIGIQEAEQDNSREDLAQRF